MFRPSTLCIPTPFVHHRHDESCVGVLTGGVIAYHTTRHYTIAHNIAYHTGEHAISYHIRSCHIIASAG